MLIIYVFSVMFVHVKVHVGQQPRRYARRISVSSLTLFFSRQFKGW